MQKCFALFGTVPIFLFQVSQSYSLIPLSFGMLSNLFSPHDLIFSLRLSALRVPIHKYQPNDILRTLYTLSPLLFNILMSSLPCDILLVFIRCILWINRSFIPWEDLHCVLLKIPSVMFILMSVGHDNVDPLPTVGTCFAISRVMYTAVNSPFAT